MGKLVSFNELDADVQLLVKESQRIRSNAYCPYSNFAVGAAFRLTRDLSIVTGCNVENSSSGATICAERSAITSAVSNGNKEFSVLAVCADWVNGQPTTPCGICRQVIFEFAPNIPVYCADPQLQQVLVTSIEELLPYGFRLNASPFFLQN